MPWHLDSNAPGCAGWAVVKDDDGSVAGCHKTEAEAQSQMAALYANEPDMTAAAEDYAMLFPVPDLTDGTPCWGVACVEGIPDGADPPRTWAPDALTFAPLPWSLKWQPEEDEGHEGSVVVGRVDAAWRDGAFIRWTGVMDSAGVQGREAERLIAGNFIRGVSIKADDVTEADVEYIYPAAPLDLIEIDGEPVEESADGEDFHLPGRHNQKDHGYGKGGKGKASDRQKTAAAKRIKARGDKFLSGDRSIGDDAVTADGMSDMLDMPHPSECIYHHGRIRSLTIVTEPAYVEATISLGESPIPMPLQTAPGVAGQIPEEVVVASGGPTQCGTTDPNWRGGPTLVAAASWTITIPEVWPESWFEEPTEAPPIGALNITAAGRIYGYLAPGGVTHRGFRGQGRAVYAPSRIDYSEFQNKGCIVAGADGQVYKINAGNVTFDCGHASPVDPRRADPSWAAAHYENSCSIAARVRVGENRHGTWVAGALLHGITPDTVERMMACALSGDWQDGKLKAALLVPVEGFPRAQTASVRVREETLVASSVPIRYEAPPAGPNLRPVLERLARGLGRDRATLTASAFEQLRQRVGR